MTSLVDDVLERLTKPEPNLPVGSMFAYHGAPIPAGWLPCDGGLVPQMGFADLYRVIGTKFGSVGNDFRLPNTPGNIIKVFP